MKYDKLNQIVYLPSNIAYLRNINKMSQNDLAKKLNYKSGSTITNWENGIRLPDVFDLWRLANIFNVSVDDIVKIDLRFKNKNLSEEEKRELKRKESINNLKKLTKEQEEEILQVVEILVKSKMTNLSDKGE